MRHVARILAIVAVAVAALVAITGCSRSQSDVTVTAPPEASTNPASSDATAQAQAVLEQLFVAWNAKDVVAFNSLVTTNQVVTDFQGLERIEVGPISAIPPQPEASTFGAENSRVFSAQIRFWGSDLSVSPGDRLDWSWEVTRGADGRWRVSGWGYG